MPFTISHVAAVLPFSRILRQGKLLSAAVIGSMVPDFALFLPAQFPRYETHGIRPLFLFCLPLGLICYWIFQLHIKPATLELLPGKLYDLWREDGKAAPFLSLRQWVLAAIGILLGAVTHLVWDGFTHENARGVQMLATLDEVRVSFMGREFSWYRFVQHTSSVIGLAFVLLFLWLGIAKAAGHVDTQVRILDRRQRHVWFAVYVIFAALAALAVFLYFLHIQGSVRIGDLIALAAVASLWGVALSLLVVSVAVRWRMYLQTARVG